MKATEKLILISRLKIGVRFTLSGLDGIYVKTKHDAHDIEYHKEGTKDLIYCADKPILKIVRN